MEKGQEALGQGDLMIRVPRETADEEEEEEATNPWQFMLFDPRRVSRFPGFLFFVPNIHHLLFQQAQSGVPCRGHRFDKNSQLHLILCNNSPLVSC